MTCLSRNDNQYKEKPTKTTYKHARAHAAQAFSACDEQTTIDGFYSAVRRSNTNPIDALLSTLENVDGDLLPLVRLNMSTDGELSALSLLNGPTHSSYALLLWRQGDLQDGNHFVAVFPLNLPSTTRGTARPFQPFHPSRAYRRAIELLLSFIYIHTVLSANRYYGLDALVRCLSTLWSFIVSRSMAVLCTRSRDLGHAMTNFSVASCRKFGDPDEPNTQPPLILGPSPRATAADPSQIRVILVTNCHTVGPEASQLPHI